MDGVKIKGSLFLDGGRRFLSARRYIIGLYIANLVLGWFTTFGLSFRIGAVTDGSLNSARLVHGFDLGVFRELINKPEVAPYSQVPLALVFSGIFVAFQLFLTGGVITQYLAVQRIDRTRFYAACGENFWKMVRIALIFIVIAGLVAGALHALRSALDIATEGLASRQRAFALQCTVLLIEVLAVLWIRMWFDLAQTQLVTTGMRSIRSSVAYGFRSARSAGGLYGSYLLLVVLASLVGACGVFLWWTASPASQVLISFLILQLTLACLLALRWWQRALAADWYQKNIPLPAAIAPATLESLPPESAIPEAPLSQ